MWQKDSLNLKIYIYTHMFQSIYGKIHIVLASSKMPTYINSTLQNTYGSTAGKL